MSEGHSGRSSVLSDQELLEARAADARQRLMRTMDALGQKRRDAMARGTRYATLGAVALVLGAGAIVVGIATVAVLSRPRQQRGLFSRLFAPGGFAPPAREPSRVNALLLRALMGAAAIGWRIAMHALTHPKSSTTPTSLGEGG
jgi:hypothetical protein